MLKLNNIFKLVDKMSSAQEHAPSNMRKIEKLLVPLFFPVFSSEDDVCGSYISILNWKLIRSKGRPRANTRKNSRIDLQLSAKRKRTDVEKKRSFHDYVHIKKTIFLKSCVNFIHIFNN